jgi:hypothetical protein
MASITLDSREVTQQIVLKFRFSRGHRLRLWLAAKVAVLVGWLAGTDVEVSFD